MIDGDFAKVAELYSTAIPTFTSFSVFPFNDLVKYAVITGIIHLSRPTLKSRLVEQSDVEMTLLEMPSLRSLLMSFDECLLPRLLCCSSGAGADPEGGPVSSQAYVATH